MKVILRVFLFSAICFTHCALRAQWVQSAAFSANSFASIGNVLIDQYGDVIYRSFDFGITWPDTIQPRAVATDLKQVLAYNGSLYLTSTYGGLLRSIDTGRNWNPTYGGGGEGPLVILSDDSLLLSRPVAGLFLSTDKGAHFRQLNVLYNDTNARCLASSGNYVYAGTVSGSIARSTDRGITWNVVRQFKRVHKSVLDTIVHTIIAIDNFVFAGTDSGGIWRSSDFGATWEAASAGLPTRNVYGLYATSPNRIFAGMQDGWGVYSSTDSGETWHEVNNGQGLGTIIPFASCGPYLFVAGSNGVYRRPLSDFDIHGSVLSTNDPLSNPTMIEVYDLLGRCVYRGQSNERPQLPFGPYIERYGGRVRKVLR